MHQDFESEPVELAPNAPECPRCFRRARAVQVGGVAWWHCAPCSVYWHGGRASGPPTAEGEREAAALLAGSEHIVRPAGEGY